MSEPRPAFLPYQVVVGALREIAAAIDSMVEQIEAIEQRLTALENAAGKMV